jgi:hypothetical protein
MLATALRRAEEEKGREEVEMEKGEEEATATESRWLVVMVWADVVGIRFDATGIEE